jgi:type II secretory pathway component PulL
MTDEELDVIAQSVVSLVKREVRDLESRLQFLVEQRVATLEAKLGIVTKSEETIEPQPAEQGGP